MERIPLLVRRPPVTWNVGEAQKGTIGWRGKSREGPEPVRERPNMTLAWSSRGSLNELGLFLEGQRAAEFLAAQSSPTPGAMPLSISGLSLEQLWFVRTEIGKCMLCVAILGVI